MPAGAPRLYHIIMKSAMYLLLLFFAADFVPLELRRQERMNSSKTASVKRMGIWSSYNMLLEI